MPTMTPAATFMLELEGQPAGHLSALEGGEPFARVANEAAAVNGVVRKHVEPVEFAPIRMSFATGMSEALYNWMADVLNHNPSAKNGAIVSYDYNLKERWRLIFDDALITEITFPSLDNGSKGVAHFSLTLQPAATRTSEAFIGASINAFGGEPKPRLSTASFRLKIAGLEAPCTKVNRIDAIIVTQRTTRVEGRVRSALLTIPNVIFRIGAAWAGDFSEWFDDFVIKGNNAPEHERTGTLEFLDTSLTSALFTLTLSQLGICRIQEERAVGDIDVITRMRVELYCEELALQVAEGSLGATVPVPAPAQETSPLPSPPSPVSPTPNEILLGIMSGRIRGDDAVRAALGIGGLLPIVTSGDIAGLDFIARRLLATTKPVAYGPSAPKHVDGALIGERWATENATLTELEQITALQSREWTAIRLENEHSLIRHLREAGVIPSLGQRSIDLERDSFVEGIVAGAARVLRTVIPHFTRSA